MTVAITLLLWTGALWRVRMARLYPSRHRRLMAQAAAGMAAATTLYLYRDALDALLGVPNLALLLMRIVGIFAGMSGLLYLRDIRPAGLGRAAIVQTALAAMVVVTVAWALSPLHDRPLSDIATLPRGWPTVYGAVLYLYGAFVFAICAQVGIQHAKATRTTDPAGAAATALIAAASISALAIILLFLGNLLAGRPWLHTLRTALVPLPAVLMILGYIAIPLVAPVIRWMTARATIRRTRGLWEALVAQHPAVELPLPVTTRFSRALRAERRLIEISDSLEQHTITNVHSLGGLAQAVVHPPAEHGQSARSVLLSVDRSPWPTPVLHLADALDHLQGKRR